jgi:hypothetical protein
VDKTCTSVGLVSSSQNNADGDNNSNNNNSLAQSVKYLQLIAKNNLTCLAFNHVTTCTSVQHATSPWAKFHYGRTVNLYYPNKTLTTRDLSDCELAKEKRDSGVTSAVQRSISCLLLWNPELHYRVHKIPLLDPVRSQLNPIYTPTHLFQYYSPCSSFDSWYMLRFISSPSGPGRLCGEHLSPPPIH